MKTSLIFLFLSSLFLHSHISLASQPIYSSTLPLTASSSSSSSSSPTIIKVYDIIRHFGAKNDGITDTTKAFLNVWKAACASPVASQIEVPSGYYLLGPIIFEGNCKSSVTFLIHGTLVAGNSYSSKYWIFFHRVNGLQIKGGVLDAKGKSLWDCKASNRNCPLGAKSLSFDHSTNINVDGLTSTNSQMFHIAINYCHQINIRGLTITADADSPNTDGIHVRNSGEISIINSRIMTGDDCIALGANNQNVWIENTFCGPGHGISIGSLGREFDKGALVQNVTVKSTIFEDTQNGFRIKTFPTSINGTVREIYFLGANMSNARNPILIDQNYCPPGNCQTGQGSSIRINDVVYKDIHGTSGSVDIITFDCSPKMPCYGLSLQDVVLSHQRETPKCIKKNVYFSTGSKLPSNCQVVTNNVA
ncbi:hypothetical protein vseg_008490 [Gypsophila vaccaria]